MKKSILFAFIFISVLAVGCSMNNKNENTQKDINPITSNTDVLLNSRFIDIEKSYGRPYSSVYYIDTDNLSHKNIENLTLDEIRDSVTILST